MPKRRQPRPPAKYVAWTENLEVALLREVTRIKPFAADNSELLQRWKLVASGQVPKINYRSAREHVDVMLKDFKKDDDAQKRSSGTEEYVTERVQLLQDLVMRMDEVATSKKRKQNKESEKRELLETTSDKLCREAEILVAKRSRTSTGSANEDSEY
ncbi:hypothetical protein B5M09_013534, partial [Aphanomyces astaci]